MSMSNMSTIIARHKNKMLTGDTPASQPQMCGCEGEGGTPCCPVQGAYEQKGVVYRASVTETTSGKTETYTGLTGRSFIDRYKEHEKDFEKNSNKTSTKLSSHVWELKDRGLNYKISWTILDRAPTYNPVTKKCILCLKEKYYIMYTKNNRILTKEMRFSTPVGTGIKAYYPN